MKEITGKKAFEEVISQDKPILLDFYANWCPPCQTLLPVVEKLADKHEDDFIISKVNVDTNPELARQFKVRSIPALFVLKGGEIQERFQGYQSEQFLEGVIQKYLAVSV